MNIVYNDTKKDLPNDQLHNLFLELGWSKGNETPFMLEHFNASFINSTYVVSAWDNDKLIGCVRVISDKVVRSIIEDLAVLPEYQNKGIGTELVNKCLAKYPKSHWLIGTDPINTNYYQKFGFKQVNDETYLYIPSKWF